MSGTEDTFHLTKEDISKMQSDASQAHGGQIPKNSEAAALQSIIDKAEQSKPDIIAERQANLPLPDAPPGPSDFNSADARTVNVGVGDQPTGNMSYGSDALREPATGASAFRTDGEANMTAVAGQGVGREGAEGLGGLPNDAVTRDAKDKSGLVDTTGADYGYPQNNDPSSANN